MCDKQKRVMPHKEKQIFLKTSRLAKIFGVSHLLPEVEDIEDWDSPLKTKRTIQLKQGI